MLEVRDLSAFYGTAKILHGLSLSIAEGDRVAILGRNGAGKSTLLKSIMNAGPDVQGRVVWNGTDLGSTAHFKRVKNGLALVPEDRRIFSHLTVVENLEFAARFCGRDPFEIEEMFRVFPQIGELRTRLGFQLSGGQQQILALARGIIVRPSLLLLDEPTEGVSPVLVQELARVVSDICIRLRISLLLCEQNIWFARQCTQSVMIIDSGEIVFRGDWEEFDANPEVKIRYLAV